jgi:type IV pilus assembly protein PilC
MALFKYVAINSNGQRITGEKTVANKDEIVRFLMDKDLTVVSISEKLSLNFNNMFSSDIGGLPLKERLVIVKQLSTMISAGIPIIQALDILVQQSEKPSLKTKMMNVYRSIEAGSTLAESFRKEAGIFTDVHLNLLAAGEKSANLTEMLDRIAEDLEKSRNLRGKIVGALIYPAIIFVVMIVVVILMITTMIPQVKELYLTLGQTELPFVTQILVDIGNLFSNPVAVLFIITILLAAYATFKYANTTVAGKRFIDEVQLKAPIFGSLTRKAEVVQFCRLFSMLMASGVQIIEAIEIVENASGNQIFKDVLNKSRNEITKGVTLSQAITKFNKLEAFPLILIKIISTGEESGKLDHMLRDMGRFYEAELDQAASNLTKSMEPLIMVIAGGMVAFLAIAVYLPMFQVGQFVK